MGDPANSLDDDVMALLSDDFAVETPGEDKKAVDDGRVLTEAQNKLIIRITQLTQYLNLSIDVSSLQEIDESALEEMKSELEEKEEPVKYLKEFQIQFDASLGTEQLNETLKQGIIAQLKEREEEVDLTFALVELRRQLTIAINKDKLKALLGSDKLQLTKRENVRNTQPKPSKQHPQEHRVMPERRSARLCGNHTSLSELNHFSDEDDSGDEFDNRKKRKQSTKTTRYGRVSNPTPMLDMRMFEKKGKKLKLTNRTQNPAQHPTSSLPRAPQFVPISSSPVVEQRVQQRSPHVFAQEDVDELRKQQLADNADTVFENINELGCNDITKRAVGAASTSGNDLIHEGTTYKLVRASYVNIKNKVYGVCQGCNREFCLNSHPKMKQLGHYAMRFHDAKCDLLNKCIAYYVGSQ